MINAIVDTNVLAASLIKRDGPNRRALRKLIDPKTPFRICYSSQIMDEYEDVLSRPFITSQGLGQEAKALVSLISRVGDEVIPKYLPAIVYPDIKDRPFLEAAVYTDAVLLTNNLRDFPFLGVHIVGPEEFLAWCDERGL